MRPWVKWCVHNHLTFLVYIVLVLSIPVFLSAALLDVIEEWYKEAKSLRRGLKQEASKLTNNE